MKSVELFAGAGGLALGCELAGFSPAKVVEWDRWACDTVRQNRDRNYPLVADWDVVEGDVRSVDWASLGDTVDLVAGGPPCQPFSTGGKARAADDSRDMFPATAEVILFSLFGSRIRRHNHSSSSFSKNFGGTFALPEI